MNLQTIQKSLKEIGSRIFQKNKYERVLKDYLALEQTRPEDMRVKLKIAELYFKTKNIDKAIAMYGHVAKIYTDQNFILKAVAVYKNILKLKPTLIEIYLKLAELYLKLEMGKDAANAYRIIMQFYTSQGNKERVLETCQKLIAIDPSPANRRKLAEIYQSLGMTKQVMEQYEQLAQIYRDSKQFDELLHIYELLLPHKADKHQLLKDVCILYLRKQNPDQAIRLMERYKLDADEGFADLYDKSKLMKKMLKVPVRQKK